MRCLAPIRPWPAPLAGAALALALLAGPRGAHAWGPMPSRSTGEGVVAERGDRRWTFAYGMSLLFGSDVPPVNLGWGLAGGLEVARSRAFALVGRAAFSHSGSEALVNPAGVRVEGPVANLTDVSAGVHFETDRGGYTACTEGRLGISIASLTDVSWDYTSPTADRRHVVRVQPEIAFGSTLRAEPGDSPVGYQLEVEDVLAMGARPRSVLNLRLGLSIRQTRAGGD